MRKSRPALRPAIVSFSSSVAVSFGDAFSEFGGCSLLSNPDRLYSEAQALAAAAASKQGKGGGMPCAGENGASLEKVVLGIEPDGMTALGPALAVALGIASCQPGSKVIVCTDGAANKGCGSLDARNKDKMVEFYSKMGAIASRQATQVSVLSIQGYIHAARSPPPLLPPLSNSQPARLMAACTHARLFWVLLQLCKFTVHNPHCSASMHQAPSVIWKQLGCPRLCLAAQWMW